MEKEKLLELLRKEIPDDGNFVQQAFVLISVAGDLMFGEEGEPRDAAELNVAESLLSVELTFKDNWPSLGGGDY